jgi:hypothetical protein
VSRVIRNFIDSKGEPPVTVLACSKIEAKRLLRISSDAALRKWLTICRENGLLLSEDGSRLTRWTSPAYTNGKPTPDRRREYVFAADSEYTFTRRYNAMIYDMRQAGDQRAGASVGFTRP